MSKKPEKIEEELRSIVMLRVGAETAGIPQDERNYAPKEGMSYSTIPDLVKALHRSFDILVLHDPLDGCLMVDLQEGRGTVGELPCKLHKNEKN